MPRGRRKKGRKAVVASARKTVSAPDAKGTPAGGSKDLLTLNELARFLDLSPFTVYQWRSRGKFPFKAKKIGRTVMVARSEASRWKMEKAASGGKRARRGRPAGASRGAGRRRGGRVGRPRRIRSMAGPVRRAGRRAAAGSALTLASGVSLAQVQSFVDVLRRGGRVSVSFGGHGEAIRIQAD